MVFNVSSAPAEAAGVLPSLAASRLLRSRWISRSSSALVLSVSRLGIRLGTAPFGSGVRRFGPGAQHDIAQRDYSLEFLALGDGTMSKFEFADDEHAIFHPLFHRHAAGDSV